MFNPVIYTEKMQSEQVKRVLVDELHRPARINFRRRPYKMLGIGETLHTDLADLTAFKSENNGYAYILIVIDQFSKFLMVKPIRTKSGPEVAQAMEEIIDSYKYKRYIRNLCSDKGREYYNSHTRALFTRLGINHYSVHTRIKSAFAERVIRTLKTWIWKSFGYQGKYRWVDLLPHLVKRYNSKVHRKIGMAPDKVNKRNEKMLLVDVFKNNAKIKHTTDLKVGMYVRTSDTTGVFRKGYQTQWSVAIYKIIQVQNTSPPTFKLMDYNNKILPRGYYREELQRVKYNDVYLIEKVIKTHPKKGTLVKFLGYPEPEWITKV